ncbi:lysosomal proton-coupled steroid conjugate and bile acid symporter SLC46A3-like isoform X2 [Branchiostoma floridae x Branchiostoma japonicum]
MLLFLTWPNYYSARPKSGRDYVSHLDFSQETRGPEVIGGRRTLTEKTAEEDWASRSKMPANSSFEEDSSFPGAKISGDATEKKMSGDATKTSEKKFDDPPQSEPVKPYCPVTVEPIAFLVVVAVLMCLTLQQQYIYYRISGNGTINQQGSSCYGNSSNSSEYQDKQGAQAEAIQWATAIQLAGGIPALIVTVLIGSLSDKLGRKLNLIIPVAGTLARLILAACVVQFNLPLAVLIPASFINGLTGNNAALIGGSFAYIADITVEGTSRYFRHAIMTAVLGMAVIVSALGGSFWFQALGFPAGISQPFWFSVGLCAFCLLYTIFAIKETWPRQPGSQLCALSNITGFIQLFRGKRKTPRWPLGVLLFSYFLLFGVNNSVLGVFLTYSIGPPFCWAPDYVGYFQVAIGGGAFLSMVTIKLFSNYPYGMVIVGYISGIGCLLLMGLAAYTPNPDVTFFMAAAVGVVQSSSTTVLRTLMSKMVGQGEQGSLFGLTSFANSLSGVAFAPLWNLVYASTIPIMPGMIFLIFAGVNLLCAILAGIVKFNVPETVEGTPVDKHLSTLAPVDKDKKENMTKL